MDGDDEAEWLGDVETEELTEELRLVLGLLLTELDGESELLGLLLTDALGELLTELLGELLCEDDIGRHLSATSACPRLHGLWSWSTPTR